MNKRPGQVNVTTEVSFCSFCGRARNLRREEHQLGNFVRTVVTCETCHRTLSSTMGVASTDTPAADEATPAAAAAEKPAEPSPATGTPAARTPAAKTPAARRAVATKSEPASTKPKATKARTTKTR